MEEIEVGEYIRTTYGEIGEYIGEDLQYGMFDYDVNGNKSSCLYKELKNHSKNIIDLIEIGDYVNGHLVINIETDKNNKRKIITENKYFDKYYEDGIAEINSILTKEQFNSIAYRLEE